MIQQLARPLRAALFSTLMFLLFVFVQVKDLNSGTFGFVQLCKDKTTNELVAIKFIERGDKVTRLRREPGGWVLNFWAEGLQVMMIAVWAVSAGHQVCGARDCEPPEPYAPTHRAVQGGTCSGDRAARRLCAWPHAFAGQRTACRHTPCSPLP